MSTAAVCIGGTVLYWDAIVMALAVPVFFLALWSGFAQNGERRGVLWPYVPLGAALSLLIARLMFWYCHQEQFGTLLAALSPGSGGGFCMWGVVLGFALAAGLLRLVRLAPSAARLLDASAPALALGMALLRMSALFNGSCRGKTIIEDMRLRRLPFAASIPGSTEFRFAAFFLGALLLGLIFLVLLGRFAHGARNRDWDVFLLFLLLFGAEEVLVDSIRYDATYFNFNAFVSVSQILSAAAIVTVLAVYSRRGARHGGVGRGHWICWVCFFVGLCVAGLSEYLVQRHGNWQLRCYALMSAGVLAMVLSTAAVRRVTAQRR